MFVTKFDGTRQPFVKEKIIRTCLRMHSNPKQAKDVADRIEKELYDGITTKEILQKIFKYLQEFKPEIKHQTDLREAIALLRPKPDFENFIGMLLKEYGYKIDMNQIIAGKCVEHEIDAVARKNNEIVLVEVKHHFQHHTFTGLSVFLEAQATFEDLVEGIKSGKNGIRFNRLLVACNTKISDHARRYANCRGIQHLGWKSPEEESLEEMVEEKKFYPITLLKDLDADSQQKLGDNGIILLKQLIEYGINELYKKTKIKKDILENLVRKARGILLL